jgi:hypothetical protein
MQISNNELLEYLLLKKICSKGNPPFPDFLDWIADRLVKVKGDEEQIDFIQHLRSQAKDLRSALRHDPYPSPSPE